MQRYAVVDDSFTSSVAIVEPGSNPTESETSLVRSSALVAVGTMLSRVTGFARIAAIAYALGASTLAGTYSYANEAPNIVYELLLGGVLTATLVPLFVAVPRDATTTTRRARSSPSRSSRSRAITVIGVVAAPWIVDLYTLNVKGANVAAQQAARHRPPAAVHAADALLRHRHAGDRDAERPPALPRGRVRAGAQQRRRDRGVPRAAPHRRRVAHRPQRARRRTARPAHRPRARPRASW